MILRNVAVTIEVKANIRSRIFLHNFQLNRPNPPLAWRKTVSIVTGVMKLMQVDVNPPTKLIKIPMSGMITPTTTIKMIIIVLIAISEILRDLAIFFWINLKRISMGMKNMSPKLENKAMPMRACPAMADQSSAGRFKVMLPRYLGLHRQSEESRRNRRTSRELLKSLTPLVEWKAFRWVSQDSSWSSQLAWRHQFRSLHKSLCCWESSNIIF